MKEETNDQKTNKEEKKNSVNIGVTILVVAIATMVGFAVIFNMG